MVSLYNKTNGLQCTPPAAALLQGQSVPSQTHGDVVDQQQAKSRTESSKKERKDVHDKNFISFSFHSIRSLAVKLLHAHSRG